MFEKKKEEKDDKYTSLEWLSTGFLYSFKGMLQDSVTLRSHRKIHHHSRQRQRLKQNELKDWQRHPRLPDQLLFCFFLCVSPLHDWTEEMGEDFCLEAALASDQTGGCLRFPYLYLMRYPQESARTCFSPLALCQTKCSCYPQKKGVFQELFRCCSPVVLLWQPDWHEACGGPAQRLYWLYCWL